MVVAALSGTLEERGPDYAVVTVGGVSLRVFAPTSTLAHLGAIGGQVRLHTYLLVRQDALALYAFRTSEERHLFEQLLTVSGIGPRGGLSLLSAMEPETVRAAIVSGDVARLTLVPGIGRKTAERMILELRSKLGGPRGLPAEPGDEMTADVVAALTAMGYTPQQIQESLRALPPDAGLTLEQRVLSALEHFRREGSRRAPR